MGAFLLQTLAELQMQPDDRETARLVVLSLLSHCRDLLGSDIHTASRSRALFEAIRHYIEEHHASALTRESVAQAFYISPNYLSHLFQKQAAWGSTNILRKHASSTRVSFLKATILKSKISLQAADLRTVTTFAVSFASTLNVPLPNIDASITAS